jgi:hypothetical protein
MRRCPPRPRCLVRESAQFFLGAHDETLSVAESVNNPDRSPPPSLPGFNTFTNRSELFAVQVCSLQARSPGRHGLVLGELCAHFLQAGSESFNFLFQTRNPRVLLLHFALFFEKCDVLCENWLDIGCVSGMSKSVKPPDLFTVTGRVGLIQLLLLFIFETAFAGSATWNLNPTSGDWNTAAKLDAAHCA